MMTFFMTLLEMSLSASVVALAVMLLRIPFKKAPKIFSYALWSVVLFRLIFPFGVESRFSLMPTFTNTVSFELASTTMPINVASYSSVGQVTNSSFTLVQIMSLIWFLGFLTILIYGVMGYVKLKKQVYFATRVRDNIFETDTITTPFIFGFVRPKIYFPTHIDPAQHEHILLHEERHLKRLDHLIKPFAYVVLALYWFNPLIWLSYFLMVKDMEMSCDEAVLKNTSADLRKIYATSLLNLSTVGNGFLNPIAFGENNVKDRVANVLDFKETKKWVVLMATLFMSIFIIGFASNRPTLAMTNESNVEDEMVASGDEKIQNHYMSNEFPPDEINDDTPFENVTDEVETGNIEIAPHELSAELFSENSKSGIIIFLD